MSSLPLPDGTRKPHPQLMILCGGGQLPDAGQLIVAGVVGRRVAVVQPPTAANMVCTKMQMTADRARASGGVTTALTSASSSSPATTTGGSSGPPNVETVLMGNRFIDFLGIGRRIIQAELRQKCGSLLSPAVQAAM